jgi:zona occludens toxin (predicted ATPase)
MYTLELCQADVDAISFIGNRYEWSKTLLDIGVETGKNIFQEYVAWKIQEAVYEDTENGRTSIPLAATSLAEKIWLFLYKIV